MPLVLLAGGGTGGHIYPNVAVAERLEARGSEDTVHFLISHRPGDARIVEQLGYPATAIDVRPLPAPSRPWRLVSFLRAWRKAVAGTARLLVEADFSAVVATGGFVSGPAVIAANRAGIPVALVNLDAVPGIANRYLARFADAVFSTYETSRLRDAQPIGLPLRQAAVALVPPAEARHQLGLEPELPHVVHHGGDPRRKFDDRSRALPRQRSVDDHRAARLADPAPVRHTRHR